MRHLLVEAFDGDFSDDDWEHTLGGWHVLVVADDDVMVAHAAVVPRVLYASGEPWRVGYVEGVATAPGKQRAGSGSLAMAEISVLIRHEFEMGALATGSHEFYERLGWERWQGPTFVRRGSEVVRTADDDDAIMVLRFGPSAAVDVTMPLTCEGRRGDDW